MQRKKGSDRRTRNVPVEVERRTSGRDRRLCPSCGGALLRSVRRTEGGTETWTFCEGCAWRDCTLQADQAAPPGDGAAVHDRVGDRRKVNVPVGVERRSGRHDRRVCPECHSPLQQHVRREGAGTLTRTYCVRCGWSRDSRQEDDSWRQTRQGVQAPAPKPALVQPRQALAELARKRQEAAKAWTEATGRPVAREDRRKVNVPVGVDRRSGREKRHCPRCGSTLQQSVKPVLGGALTRTYCTKCDFALESRQVDEERLRALLGFQAAVLGSPARPWLELPAEFLQTAHLKPGDTVFFEPIYTPGSEESFKWVVKTHRS